MAEENAIVYLADYSRKARRAGESKEAIDKVIKDATSGDYEHLRKTLLEAVAKL